MTDKVKELLRDRPVVRWTALVLIASAMFFGYMFVDVLSPLQSLLERTRGWDPETYGTFASSEYFLNVFVFFLIFAGIILDKMGVRFTAVLSGVVMVLGASIKLYAVSEYFGNGGFGYDFFTSFLPAFPASAKVACIGFAIFGCGCEMAGVTVSKAIVKWFKGKELALAMGLEMAIARLGVFAVFRLSPFLADNISVVKPVAVCCILLCIGLISFCVYFFMDRALDKQVGESLEEPEEPFKIRDLGKLFTSKTFLIVAALCVLYYSAIFPFQKFASNMLENRLNLSPQAAGNLFSYFPMGAMVLTPLLGYFLDRKGKGATMLIIGAVLMCLCHLVFALCPLNKAIAYAAIILLGISFSLVPAALWPSVPKLVENRYLGSGYSVIFWIQNIGLFAFPILIGWSLNATNPGVSSGNKTYTLLLHYSTYDVTKTVHSAATFVMDQTDNQTLRDEMQNCINNSTLQNENMTVLERMQSQKAEVDRIVTPEIRTQIMTYAVEAKEAVQSKDKQKSELVLSKCGDYLTSVLSTDQINELNRYLPLLNANFALSVDTGNLGIKCLKEISSSIALLKTPYSDTVNNAALDMIPTENMLGELHLAETVFMNGNQIEKAKVEASRLNPYNYRVPMLIFAFLGVLAFILGIWLKAEDKRKGYGLEKPNIVS